LSILAWLHVDGACIKYGMLNVAGVESSSQLNMRGVFLHVLGDALGSVVVIISALFIKFVDAKWKYKVDPAMRQAVPDQSCFLLKPGQILPLQ